MTTVFVSGSRNISSLNQEVRDRLQNILDQHLPIIVGDANGADKAVQKYLHDKQYVPVTVYCSGDACRNNIGSWQVSKVQVESGKNGRDFYTRKDKEMAKLADYGFVLWDGKSPGSYENVMELLKRNKKALVYFFPEKAFVSISTLNDAQKLLGGCDPTSQEAIKRKIKLPSLVKEIEAAKQEALANNGGFRVQGVVEIEELENV